MATALTYTVAVKANPRDLPLFFSVNGWTELRGCIARLTAVQRDTAIAEAVAAGFPYDVIAHEGESAGGTRIGGTAVIVAKP